MLENALVAGFTSVGMDVTLFGPLPTPAIGMLTKSMRADLGVMISASHNPYADNGIKLFGPDGYKLSDADETAIEALIDGDVALADAPDIGRARRVEDARGRYIHFAKATFPDDLTLDGLKIVVDCANGAAYQVAPSALWELGAEVIAIGVTPNGKNINDQVGSTAPETLCETVVASGAHIGIALDGDADRLIVVDETGRVIDGDQLMAVIATGWARAGNLRNGGLVATVMSNLGLERHLSAQGIKLIKAIMSAASNRGTSSCRIMPPPAMGWSRRCRSSPSWSARGFRRANCSIASIRCRNCSRTCASRAASRSTMPGSRQ
jgi:phosphoglucosamine mutase